MFRNWLGRVCLWALQSLDLKSDAYGLHVKTQADRVNEEALAAFVMRES